MQKSMENDKTKEFPWMVGVRRSRRSVNFSNGTILVSGGIVYAISPYDPGYNQGCSDARLGGHPYINQNPTHIQVFMNGYKY